MSKQTKYPLNEEPMPRFWYKTQSTCPACRNQFEDPTYAASHIG